VTTDTLLQKVVEFTTPAACLLCSNEPKIICDACYDRALTPLPPGDIEAVTAYDDIGKELIRRFKFEGDQEAGRLCARYMAEVIRADDYDVVVAATTTPARRRQRGYDQAELLGREIARRIGRPYVRALVRVKNTHQIGKGRLERLSQSEGLYVVINMAKISSKRVLLVDDVTTTGATLRSAAASLHAAGATRVYCLAFARDE
jgi:ComF family protein